MLNFRISLKLFNGYLSIVLIGRWLSAMPRIAGTRADLRQAKALEQIWKDQGLDNSGIEAYDVLLSYPGNNSFPNKVSTKKLSIYIEFNQ